jgi:adenylate cyclase
MPRALKHWRARDFAGAAACLAPIAEADSPAALLLKRAKAFSATPPDPQWDGVTALEGK